MGLGLPREAVEGATSTIPATSLLQGTRVMNFGITYIGSSIFMVEQLASDIILPW